MMGLLNDDRSDKLMMGLLGLQGLAGLGQRPQYTTNIAQATAPQENQWMSQLPGVMALMQRNRLLRDQTKSQIETQALTRDKLRMDLAKDQQDQAKRAEYTAALQSGDPARIAAARAAVNPDAMWQHQYGWQKPEGQIGQERDEALWKSNLAVGQAQKARLKTPEEMEQERIAAREAFNRQVALQQSGQVLSPEAEAQRLRLAQTQPLSPEVEAQQIRVAQAKAAASAEGKAPTEGERKAAGFYDRMVQAEKVLAGMAEKGYDGRGWGAATANVLGAIPLTGGILGNKARGEENERIRQAQLDWAGAKLRFESGATITNDEIAQEALRYFPQPGEGDAVVAQKAAARAAANEAMRKNAGRAAPERQEEPGMVASEADIRATMSATLKPRAEVIRLLKAKGYKVPE